MQKNQTMFGVMLLALVTIFFVAPTTTRAATPWSATPPEGFTPVTWAKATGVSSFFKAQSGNGFLDYLTVIYLPYAQIKLIASTTPMTTWSVAQAPFTQPDIPNLGFTKMVTEQAKADNPAAKFLWNMPYFNINGPTTDLSMALRSVLGKTPYTTTGSRPLLDMNRGRRLLTIDNTKSSAEISDFDEQKFLTTGDQAVEGFAPSVLVGSDGDGSARLFVGVRAGGKELVVYCSRGASVGEASAALLAAGVPVEQQLQADGGYSATCAYNLPGQYFVEPGRMLPHLMGAYPIAYRATVINNGVNVRSGPGTSNKAITKMNKGATVIVYEEKNGWARIDESSQWILASLLKKD